jgi:phage RecT family recombinase
MSEEKKESKALAPIDAFRGQLTAMESQIKMVLPQNIAPEKFTRVVLTAVQQNPDLLNADRKSLFMACMQAAGDGLLPNGNEAAMVVYRTKSGNVAKYMPMVAGILKKVRNSGELLSICCNVVREGEEFKRWVDENGDHLNHTPSFSTNKNIIAVYAIAKTKDGGSYIEVMSEEDVERVRNSSKAKDSGPWSDWWDAMAKKTVIRRLSKKLPMSSDLEEVIRRDDEDYEFPIHPALPPPCDPKDYMPGMERKVTCEQFCKDLKGVGGAYVVVEELIHKYESSGLTDWCKRLEESAVRHGIFNNSHKESIPESEKFPFENDSVEGKSGSSEPEKQTNKSKLDKVDPTTNSQLGRPVSENDQMVAK